MEGGRGASSPLQTIQRRRRGGATHLPKPGRGEAGHVQSGPHTPARDQAGAEPWTGIDAVPGDQAVAGQAGAATTAEAEKEAKKARVAAAPAAVAGQAGATTTAETEKKRAAAVATAEAEKEAEKARVVAAAATVAGQAGATTTAEAEKARVAAAAAAVAGQAGATMTAGTGMDYKSVAAILKAPANVKSKMHALFLCKFVSKPTATKRITSGVAIDLMGAAEAWATYKAGNGELTGDFTQPFLNEDKGTAE